MSKIIKNSDGSYSFRLDNAYTNSLYLVTPYEKEVDGVQKKSYFGGFKFDQPEEVEKILMKIVDKTGWADTIFGGSYPAWVKDEQYGYELKINNKVNFFEEVNGDKIDPDDIHSYKYAIEVNVRENKDGGIFLVVKRAIKTDVRDSGYRDDLFEDEELPF